MSIQQEIDSVIHQNTFKCEQCGATATKFCFQCNVNLCDKCFNEIHGVSKILQKHQYGKPMKVILCQEHDGYPVTVFCAQCQKLVCSQCVLSSHKDHPIQQLSQTCEIIKNECNNQLSNIKRFSSQVINVEQQLENKISDMKNDCESILAGTKKNFDILIEELQQKQIEVEKQINVFKAEKISELEKKQIWLKQLSQELINAKKLCSSLMDNGADVDAAKAQVQPGDSAMIQQQSQQIQLFLDNQDKIVNFQDKVYVFENIVNKLKDEMQIRERFQLDFDSVQRFVQNIEDLYMVIERMTDEQQVMMNQQNQQMNQ